MSTQLPHDLVRLTTAANAVEASILQQALEREGIGCKVLGDVLDNNLGFIQDSVELWVAADDLSRAEAFLQKHRSHEHPTDS